MEKKGYRENLALLNARFPGKDMLTRTEVAAFIGVDMGTLRRMGIRFNQTTRRVSKADLARQIGCG